MEEPKEPRLSRRDFLKLLGTGLGAVVLAACSRKEAEVTPDFEAVDGANSRLALSAPSKEGLQDVRISYKPSSELLTRMQVRKINGEPKFLPFEDGATRIRKVGEILEPSLYKVRENSVLPEGVWVNLHESASVTNAGLQTKRMSDWGEGLYALPVITRYEDWMRDGTTPPVEYNANPPVEEWENLGEFGQGWAVGKLNENKGTYDFVVLGFVKDARALEAVREE